MYNQPYGFNSMPTATQPYGYPMTNFGNYNQQTQQMQQTQQNSNTNMIFVSGIDDVKQRYQMNNTTMVYYDNDKPILYKKTLDNKGQFEIKEFEIKEKALSKEPAVDLSGYVKASDLDGIKKELKTLQDQFLKLKVGGAINGTTANGVVASPTTTTTPI